jgi:hypothetical protein
MLASGLVLKKMMPYITTPAMQVNICCQTWKVHELNQMNWRTIQVMLPHDKIKVNEIRMIPEHDVADPPSFCTFDIKTSLVLYATISIKMDWKIKKTNETHLEKIRYPVKNGSL